TRPASMARASLTTMAIAVALLALSACGGGSDGLNGADGSDGLTTLATVAAEAPGLHCTLGGSSISAGLDANANGVLETTEISSLQYVCDGAGGATGATGATGAGGAVGSSGPASLVLMTSEAAGVH